MSGTAVTTTQIILDAIKYQQTPAQWESVFLKEGIDWDDLIVHAMVLGLAPQLHHHLTSWHIKMPTRIRTKLATTYTAHAQRNQAIYQQLSEFLTLCQTRELQPVALKGIHLAACYYVEPALRPMNDIDLLFTPEALPVAQKALLELGYSGKYKSADLGAGVTKHTSTFRRPSIIQENTINPYLSTVSDRTIEPHTSLEESWFGLKIDITPGIRERAEIANLLGNPCLVLSPEDLLLHLCLHFCFHLIQGSPSLVQLADLLAVCQRPGLNWDIFVERAVDNKAAHFALAALTLARKLLDVPLPASAFDQLSQATPTPMRRYIETLTLSYILKRTQQKPLTTVPQRIQRGFLDRAETARWGLDWYGRIQVWRTLFQPAQTDTGQMVLQRLRRHL